MPWGSEEENKKVTEELKTIEDIELFEREHGCNFVFVNHWDNGVLYTARVFKEQNKEEVWKSAIINALNTLESGKAKELCKKDKGVITLFDKRDNNNKSFRLGVPDSGHW